MVKLIISEKDIGINIKTFLESFHLAKSKVHQLFQSHNVRVNHDVVNQTHLLQKNDVVEIDLTELKHKPIVPFEGPIDVLYEDEDILLLYKPKFLLVHTDGNTIDSLTNRVAYYKKNSNHPILPVHRLDYETSGILIFGKHPLSQAFLSYQFEDRLVEKKYIAVVEGVLKKDEGIIDKPIAKDRHSNKQRVSHTGQSARSSFKVIERYENETLCEIRIMGGRKHQIRVHMAAIGHPIVGDKLYGHLKKNEKHLHLEFTYCKFIHPANKEAFEYQLKK